MIETIKLTFSIWKKNSIQLILLSLLSLVLPTVLQSIINLNYFPIHYILHLILVGAIYCYINHFQKTGKRSWKSYFDISHVILSFVILGVTIILFQKFFNQIITKYTNTDLYIDFTNTNGWSISNLFATPTVLSNSIIFLATLIYLPLLLTPTILATEKCNITLALSKSSLIFFKYFWMIGSAFLLFEVLIFSITKTTNGVVSELLKGFFLSIFIPFYFSIYFHEHKHEIEKEDDELLETFGKNN